MQQTYPNIEVILIDDGSDDGSAELCEQFVRNDSRIICLHQTNQGQSAARNRGLEISHGKYIAFLDSDDYWELDLLEYLLNILDSTDSEIAICAVKHVGFRNNRDIAVSTEIIESYTGIDAARNVLLGEKGFSGSACHALFKSNLFAKERFLEGHVYEDLDIMVRLALNARKISVSNIPKYNYCFRENNSSSLPVTKKSEDLKIIIRVLREYANQYTPELLDAIDHRYISNSLFLLRTLKKDERKTFRIIREEMIKTEPKKKMMTKTDRLLWDVIKKSKDRRIFYLVSSILRSYRNIKECLKRQ